MQEADLREFTCGKTTHDGCDGEVGPTMESPCRLTATESSHTESACRAVSGCGTLVLVGGTSTQRNGRTMSPAMKTCRSEDSAAARS
jgi:hypothetical protein